jgi:hypothetical protein
MLNVSFLNTSTTLVHAPAVLPLKEKAHSTHWIGGWVGLGTSLDDMERENSQLYWDLDSDPSIIQPTASCYNDCATPVGVIQLKTVKCKAPPPSKKAYGS